MRVAELVVLALAMFLAGCVARTQLASFRDPGFSNERAYDSVVVMVATESLADRADLEAYGVRKLSEKGVTAVRSVDIIPIRSDDRSMKELVKQAGAQALLVFHAIDQDVSSTYIPPTLVQPGTVTAQNYGLAHQTGGTWFQDGYTTYSVTPPVVAGDYTIDKPVGRYGALLIDAYTEEIVWLAEGRSRGNALARFGDLHRSMGEETVRQLFEDGVLRAR